MKYLSDGHAVEVVATLPMDRGFVVDPCVEDAETGEPVLLGELMIVDDVYDKPPIEYIDSQIRDKQMKLNAVHEELRLIEQECRLAQAERKRLLEKLKQLPALRRIEEFLDGKITHVVSSQYGRIHITPIDEMVCDSDREYRHNPKSLKLMTLYGQQPGELSFRVNKYKDGSGSSSSEYEAFPCCSEEEAKSLAGKLIDEQIADARGYYLEESVKSADKIGHPVPDGLREVIRLNNIEKKRNEVEEARKKLHDAEQQLMKIVNPVAAAPATPA
jgi:hypothetical protein